MTQRPWIDVRAHKNRLTNSVCTRSFDGAKRRMAGAAYALACFGLLYFWAGDKVEAAGPDAVSKSGSRIGVENFELVGGWRVYQQPRERYRHPPARGGLAIDFESGRVFAGGDDVNNFINEYKLVDMGKGEDVDHWPILEPIATHKKFWGRGYAGGLDIRKGVLWVSSRVFYDMKPSTLTLYGKHLETGNITTKETGLSQPAFGGGFIKGHADWLIGCGGYEPRYGSVSGPTLATADGKILMNRHPHETLVWEDRELRPANYTVEQDSWVGLAPRDGVGRWASDKVYAGGVWHPRGLMYWAVLGVGDLKVYAGGQNYTLRNETFGRSNQSWLYTYDPQRYNQVEFARWPHGVVHGHEIGPDGTLYLLTRDMWKSGSYKTGSVIKVFRIKE